MIRAIFCGITFLTGFWLAVWAGAPTWGGLIAGWALCAAAGSWRLFR